MSEERLWKFRKPDWMNSATARGAGVYAAGALVGFDFLFSSSSSFSLWVGLGRVVYEGEDERRRYWGKRGSHVGVGVTVGAEEDGDCVVLRGTRKGGGLWNVGGCTGVDWCAGCGLRVFGEGERKRSTYDTGKPEDKRTETRRQKRGRYRERCQPSTSASDGGFRARWARRRGGSGACIWLVFRCVGDFLSLRMGFRMGNGESRERLSRGRICELRFHRS